MDSFSKVDLFGESKGIELSDRARSFLDELNQLYYNVNCTVADLSMDSGKQYFEEVRARKWAVEQQNAVGENVSVIV